jgi:hypothetical protein
MIVYLTIHQKCSHETEFSALERFRENISPHRFRRTVLKIEFTCVVKMANEEVFGLNMLGSSGT